MVEGKKGIMVVGCWGDGGRDFWEGRKNEMEGGEYGVGEIELVYEVEGKGEDEGVS